VLATGAPPARHFRLCRGADCIETPLIPYDDAGRFDSMLCVRRQYLDGILWEAARATPGVVARDRTTVRRLRWDGDRVTGVDVAGPDGEESIDAALVIGADGRSSLVARQVSAAEVDVVPAGRYWYYGYFENARLPDPTALIESDSENDTVVSMPTNDGLMMVILGAYNEDFDAFRKDHQRNYLARVHAHPCIAEMLQGASLAEPVRGIAGIRGYYRQAWGPGWALVGDAAHLKDPIVARGISEALRGAEWLAEALVRRHHRRQRWPRYAATLRERTWSKALNARMLSRPDWHMTAEPRARSSRSETVTLGRPGGLPAARVQRRRDLRRAIFVMREAWLGPNPSATRAPWWSGLVAWTLQARTWPHRRDCRCFREIWPSDSRGRQCMRRLAIIGIMPVLVFALLAQPANAGKLWCPSDPVVSLDHRTVSISVSIPGEYLLLVNGPTTIEIKTPRGVDRELILNDLGFMGHGSIVTFVDGGGVVKDNEFPVEIRVSVPVAAELGSTENQVTPLQVTVMPDNQLPITVTGTSDLTRVRLMVTGR
jgi:2-polyprenyl-6-methoxyphenol hydroxylase-like FAD-dependent oxidoreductase